VRRELPEGYELDDDAGRVDIDAVHRFLALESYWAAGRPRETVERLVREASRVVGLYHDGLQVGFCRAVTDRVSFAYLADVYVLAEHRGRGLGEGLVREMVEASGWSVRWLLHTGDGHGLYQKFGFTEPSPRVMERSA